MFISNTCWWEREGEIQIAAGWESVYCHAGSLWDGSLFTVINILVASRGSAGKDGENTGDWEVVMGMIGESRD